jgi:hypothetical protein
MQAESKQHEPVLTDGTWIGRAFKSCKKQNKTKPQSMTQTMYAHVNK